MLISLPKFVRSPSSTRRARLSCCGVEFAWVGCRFEPRVHSSSIVESRVTTISSPLSFNKGRTRARPRVWRTASTKAIGFLLNDAASTRVSRMVPRSRMDTCSRRSCCNTFCTSPRLISLGISSSASFG